MKKTSPEISAYFRRRLTAAVLLAACAAATAPAVLRGARLGGSFEYLAGFVDLRETPLNPSNIMVLPDFAAVSELRATLSSDDKTTMILDGRATMDASSGISAFEADQGYLSFSPAPAVRVRAGRQRLGFGAGYLWNPVNDLDARKDVFNPAKYTRGIDAVSLSLDTRRITGAPSSVSAQVMPPPASGRLSDSAVAAQYYILSGIFEFGAAGSLRRTSAGDNATHFGFYSTTDAAGSVIGIEAAVSRSPDRPAPERSGLVYSNDSRPLFLVNINRRASAKSFMVVEYFYDGFGFDADGFESVASLLRSSYTAYAAALSPYLSPGYSGRNNFFATLSSEISPEVSFSASVMLGADTSSGFFYPVLAWEAARDLAISLEGISSFSGERTSEYSLSPAASAAMVRAVYYF